MIIGNNKEVKKIYKDNEAIIDIKKGTLPIFSRGSIMESLLTLPAKITAVTKKIKDLKLYGNTEQETTTGKNKLDLSGLTTKTANGITITPVYENGKLKHIAITGTPTGTSWNGMKNITLSAGTYTFSGINISNNAKTGLRMELHNTDDDMIVCYTNNKTPTFTINETKTYKFVIWVQSVQDFPITPIYLTPQVETGNSATSYEPYTNGPSPNPDYPQEVKTVTGRQEISVSGKNLFDKNKTLDNYFYTSSGTTSTYSKAQFVNQKVIASQKNIVISYKHRYDQQGGSSINAYVRFVQYDKNGNFISRIMIQNNNATATLDDNTAYFILCVDNGTDAYFEDLQVEYGSTPTTYEAFKGGSYEINLGSMELCKINDYKDYIYKSNGTWYKHKVIGKVILNGSETGWNASANYEGWYITISDIKIGNASDISASPIYCNYYKQRTRNTVISSDYGVATGANKNVTFRNQNYVGSSELNNFKTWLSTHNTEVYYVLATPVEEEITDTTLISQLEAISLVNGDNYISSSSTNLEISEMFIKYRGE